jgi:hypothetical protein
MIPRESNDKLCDFARFFTLDGDWMTCKKCKRNLIASRDGEPLQHAAGCKNADRLHPWAELRALIAPGVPVECAAMLMNMAERVRVAQALSAQDWLRVNAPEQFAEWAAGNAKPATVDWMAGWEACRAMLSAAPQQSTHQAQADDAGVKTSLKGGE